MKNEQLDFIVNGFLEKIVAIPPGTPPNWGKLGLQQMIEHLSDSVRMANGKDVHTEIKTPAERLQAVRDFLYSEREFKPGTRNALMGEEPLPVRNPSMEAAIAELKEDIRLWQELFEATPGCTARNPFFGDLDYEGWIRLFHKHFSHHLRQFTQP